MLSSPKNLPAQGEKLDLPAIKAATLPARIVRAIYLGRQEVKNFDKPNEKLVKPRFMVFFELPTEARTVDIDGVDTVVPRTIIREFNVPAKYNEKSALIQLWEELCDPDTEGYEGLAGKACLVKIGHTKSDKPKIANVSAPMEGMTIAEPMTTVVYSDDFDVEALEAADVPEFVRETITNREGD